MVSHSPEEPSRANWLAILSISFSVATMVTAELIPASLLPRMASGLGITEGMAGQSISAAAAAALVSSLLVTTIIRDLDRRWVVLSFSALLIASSIVVGSASNYTTMLAGRILLGLGLGGFWSMAASVAMRLVPVRDIPKALSIVFGGVSISMIIAAPLGSFLGEIVGWRGVFHVVAGLGVLCLVWQAATLPSLPAKRSGNVAAVFRLLTRRGIPLPMIALFALFAGQFSFFTYVRTFLEQIANLDVDGVSFALLLFGLANFVGTFLSSKAMNRSLRMTLALAPLCLAVCSCLLTLFGTAASLTVVIIAIWGFTFAFIPVAWSTWVARNLSDDAESGGSLQVAVIQIANTIGAAFGGFMLDRSGPVAPIIVAGILTALTFVLVMTGVRVKARAADGTGAVTISAH